MSKNSPIVISDDEPQAGKRRNERSPSNIDENPPTPMNTPSEENQEGEIIEEEEKNILLSNNVSVKPVEGDSAEVPPPHHQVPSQQYHDNENRITHRSFNPNQPTTPSPSPTEKVEVKSNIIHETPPEPKKVESNYRKYGLCAFWLFVAFLIGKYYFSSESKTSLAPKLSKIKEKNWRRYVDPEEVLPKVIRSNILASLKPVSASALDEKTVATLLILSENEETAAGIGRCLLQIVNSASNRNGSLPEIDFRNDATTKLEIDEYLLNLLKPDETIIGVLIRNIDNLSSEHSLERARLLFSYCDGENPKIPNRFIIMTASADGNLREKFASKWVKESDFVDPLMSRISPNTITIPSDQTSICKI